MPNPQLNPALRIYPRRGQIVVWAPAQPQPVLFTLEQIGMLGLALESGDWSRFAEPDRQYLRAAGVLLAGPDTAAETAPVAIDLPAPPEGERLPTAVKLDGTVCLQPGQRGWIAWSPVLQDYCSLSQDVALWALSCGPGRAIEDLLRQAGAQAATVQTQLARLLAAGLLRPAHLPQGAAQDPESPTQNDAVHLRNGDPWSGLTADGRIPIYFVTHHVDHLPLALGMLRAAIAAHDDGALLKHYLPLPIVSLNVNEVQNLFRRFGPGIWLFSNYMWSFEYNRLMSARVKAADARNITIHGGPSAPKYEEACARFMQENPHVDVVVRGEGEVTLVDALQQLAQDSSLAGLCTVPGLTFRSPSSAGGVHRTPERLRVSNVDELPSPYLHGMFDHYGGQVVAAILETNRGCPYACTFCDWGSATAQKIRSFDLQRVKDEIDWIGRQRIRVLWIADANYGIFRRDIEIAEHIAETKARYGYPREVVVNYPKNATDKIADIVKIFARAAICSQGIISIQTTDPTTLAVIRRDNIKTRKYDELGDIFRRENLPLSTDLMIGLPGATVKSFKADLQYYFDDDVGVKAYRTQLLPNSPMSDPDYLREHAIRVDAEKFLISTSSYSEADLSQMEALWTAFDIADGYALLRYVARYLQWEHGIAAGDFIQALVAVAGQAPSRYPAITWVLQNFLHERQTVGGWTSFYAQIADFTAQRFGIHDDPGFEIALQVNQLMMPQEGRRFPETHALPHDFVSYFQHHVRVRHQDPAAKRLLQYPPGELTITDPYRMCELDYRAIEQYDNHQVFFELASSISRRRSVPNFVEQHGSKVADVA